MADMLEIANEVQDTLGRSYGMPDDIDEADLDAGWLLIQTSFKEFFCYILQCISLAIHLFSYNMHYSGATVGVARGRSLHNHVKACPSFFHGHSQQNGSRVCVLYVHTHERKFEKTLRSIKFLKTRTFRAEPWLNQTYISHSDMMA